MVTDPDPDDEERPGGAGDGDGSASEDPIEEVDFWEEVGESRPIEEEDLEAGDADAAPRSPGPEGADEGEVLPDADERWPGLDVDEDDSPEGEPEADDAGLDLHPGSGDDGDAYPPTPGDEPAREPDRAEGAGSGAADASDEDDGIDLDRESAAGGDPIEEVPDPTEAEARTEGETGADGGSGEPTEVVTRPEAEEPDIPRLRERGPVEAGPEPREGVPEAEGPCHLCGDDGGEDARYACVSCERPACPSHMWIMFGLCEGCATEEDIRKLRGERTREDWAGFLEIKWVT